MALEMMTTKNNSFIAKTVIFFSILLISCSAFADTDKWMLGACRFVFVKGQTNDSVTTNMSEMIPLEILSKLSTSLERSIMPDESFERKRFKLRTERQSLYLQLSAEYKKRDALVLQNYSNIQMKTELKKQDKKIKDIQKKLEENIASLKKEEEKAEQEMKLLTGAAGTDEDDTKVLSEKELLKNLFKNIFDKEQSLFTEEKIAFYQDNEGLFKTTNEAEVGYTDFIFEKQVVNSGINGLITGTLTSYGNYISVNADFYKYPGAEKAGSVMEVGSVDDMDYITSSIASQLLPLITNAMPIEFTFEIEPKEAAENLTVYIDDVLQKNENKKIVLNSGTHRIQLISKGYMNAGTTYFFEGNQKYKIHVKFEEEKIGYLQVGAKNNAQGNFYMNGEAAEKIDEKRSQIAINGKVILGAFITEEGNTAYYYVPEKLNQDGNFVSFAPKAIDRMEYIDKRRKWMYGSYTLFMASLIPMFYTYGNYQNQVDLYKKHQTDYTNAKNWQTATTVCEVITIGCGVLWGIELVRYLVAANSVLPQNVKQDYIVKEHIEEPIEEQVEAEGVENNEEVVQ